MTLTSRSFLPVLSGTPLADAARLLEVQVRTVKHWCEQGDDRMKNAQRVDGGWRVSRDDLLLILSPKKASRT